MLVKLETGVLAAAYSTQENGLKVCSWCGMPFRRGSYCTVKTVYHPKSGQAAKVALCDFCTPFEMLEPQPSDPVAVDELPTKVMNIVRTSTPSPTRWERERNADTPDYMPTVKTGTGFVRTLKELVK